MENLAKPVGLTSNWCGAAALVLLLGSVACGPMEAPGTESTDTLATQEQRVGSENGITVNGITVNGITVNGITVNGITVNGITVNGITVNGITVNGLASADFARWFTQDTAQNATLMKYMVRCAVPEGETRSFQDPTTGATYTWQGLLGLTPGWASGHRMTRPEEQLISACLAAHLNKFGMHVPLSILGRTARQEPIPYSSEELQTFSRREACFFGNLFTEEGIFAGVDRDYLTEGESSPRACGLSTAREEGVSQCSPLVHVQNCETFCTLDPTGTYYTECTYNGRTYLPLTTRIRTQDVYTCGDGVCQFTESCGTGSQPDNCMADCGACE